MSNFVIVSGSATQHSAVTRGEMNAEDRVIRKINFMVCWLSKEYNNCNIDEIVRFEYCELFFSRGKFVYTFENPF